VDLLASRQLNRSVDGLGRITLRVADNELDFAAVDATGGVELGDSEGDPTANANSG
jgi:hypothetical protein